MCLYVFAALFAIAKIWKQPKYPSIHEWTKKKCYIDTMEYYSAIKRKELLSFAITWMDLEGIMFSEISQVEENKYHDFTYLWNIKTKQNRKNKIAVESQTLRRD